MAELQWQGKTLDLSTKILAHEAKALLQTCEVHPSSLTAKLAVDMTWQNRLIRGERLAVLAALLPQFAGRVNLVYIDPPFMTGRAFKNGSQLVYSDKWQGDLDTYLQWLAITLRLLYELLAEDGSLYVHLDWRVTHYARIILDEIFGSSLRGNGAGFQNEIIWHYQSGGRATNHYARKHDTILFYTKSTHYCFHSERVGERRGHQQRNHMRKYQDEHGRVSWSINSHGRTYTYSEESHMTPADVWNDISHLHQRDPERNGYATQKPAALLERILLASSEPDQLVLDCFCGSGVTPAVAEELGRRWLASDQGEQAIAATRARLLAMPPRNPFIVQKCDEISSTTVPGMKNGSRVYRKPST